MPTLIKYIFGSIIAVVVVAAAVSPEGGVVYQSPIASAGLAMIGLGLIKSAAQRKDTAE